MVKTSTRKFYRTIIEVEVLSEEPWVFHNLQDVAYQIREGDWSGECKVKEQNEVAPYVMAQLLLNQGSDPSFFQLDEKGRDIE